MLMGETDKVGGGVAGTLNVSIPADILFSSDSMQLHFSSADLDKKKKKEKLALPLPFSKMCTAC